MTAEFSALTVNELVALALEASRRGDSGHAIEYLKSAALRPDVSAPVCFLLGSEYAQIGLVHAAVEQFQRALVIDAGYAIARFQLGLLFYAQQDFDAAHRAWAPLSSLGQAHPLALFQDGLSRLAAGQFDDAMEHLEKGIAANHLYPPLNTDMARLMERVRAIGRNAAGEGGAEEGTGHLLLNIYARGQLH